MMRVTRNLLVDKFLRIHKEIMDSLERASYQLSTGKRLEQPSDDPAGTSQILTLKRNIEEMDRFLKNMDVADTWLGITDSAFDKLDRYIERVKELALQGANDTQDADSRSAIAHELGQIFEELVDIGNTKAMDKYVFGGTNTANPPFAYNKFNSVRLGVLPDSNMEIEVSEAFSDLYQFDSGSYKLFIKREGDSLRIWMENEKGEVVQIDSNGSDDSGTSANVFVDRAVFKPSILGGKIYGTFDTGRGFRINFNGVDLTTFDTLKVVELEYVKGGEVVYTGNGEEQPVQIGYNNRVVMNTPGEGVFKPVNKTLAAQVYSKETLYESLPFDRLEQPTGSVFEIEGTAHNGLLAGSAYVVAPNAVDFQRLGGATANITLKFYINQGGTIVSSSITLGQGSYEKIEELVDVVKSLLDANHVLRDRVEVSAQGDHLVFHLVDPGANYMYVKEESPYTESVLGFKDGVGSWGFTPEYVVSQRIRGRVFKPITANETFEVTTITGSFTVSVVATDVAIPLYTAEKIEPRLFSEISAGTTIRVSAGGTTYKLTFSDDVTTLDELIKQWNDVNNWTSATTLNDPPVVMVKEGETNFRLVSMLDVDQVRFTTTSAGTLYLTGIAGSYDDTEYTLSYQPYMNSLEYTALRLAYHISQDSGYSLWARTDGGGGIEVVDKRGNFEFRFSDPNGVAAVFPKEEKNGNYISNSEIDTVKELINRVEEIYRYHVRGYVKDNMLYFEDKMGGESDFDINISPAGGNRKALFSTFFVMKEGRGVDVFDIVRDLKEAHAENIPRRMIDLPSKWESEVRGDLLHTDLTVMTDGEFRGDYNTTWHVNVATIQKVAGDTKIRTNRYTAFFAENEIKVATSSVTLEATSPITFVKSNGEEVTRTITSSFTLDASDPSAYYRVYLESGSYEISSGGTLILNGRIKVLVDSDTGTGDITATYSSVSTIKYIEYEGSLRISASDVTKIQELSEDEKTNLLLTITDSDGRIVKTMIVKHPYREYYVRDGVYISFSSGQVRSGDSFTLKVGGGIEEKVGLLDEAYQQVLGKRTEVGARMESVKMARDRYELYIKHAKDRKAPLEDVDLAEATMELQKAQTALRAALMASVRLFTPTLLDFLR